MCLILVGCVAWLGRLECTRMLTAALVLALSTTEEFDQTLPYLSQVSAKHTSAVLNLAISSMHEANGMRGRGGQARLRKENMPDDVLHRLDAS